MLKGIKRITSTKPPKARLPITPAILRQVRQAANKAGQPSADTLMVGSYEHVFLWLSMSRGGLFPYWIFL